MKTNLPATPALSRLTTEVKYAIIERSWSRYGHDASSTNGYAKNTVRRWNKAERKAAKAFCRQETGNSRTVPTRLGTYHAS